MRTAKQEFVINQFSNNKIIIADDHPLFRNALIQAVNSTMPEACFLEAANISELESILAQYKNIDLLLMDLHMPGAKGFVGLAHVVEHYPQLPVVMVSANESLAIAASAQQYGALGFIPKSASINQISKTIEQVLIGELCFPEELNDLEQNSESEVHKLVDMITELTPKQLGVFNLLSNGLLNKQIAYELKVTEATVKAHVTAIMRKLGVCNRTQVILIANKVNIDENYDET